MTRAACAGFRIFRGSCSSQVGQSGLTLFDGVVERFKAMAETDGRLIENLRQWPDADLRMLTTMLPDLAPLVGSGPGQASMPEAFLEEPKLEVLQRFLASLGCDGLNALDKQGANDCCYTFGPIVEANEHCNIFVYYYPKSDNINCF